MLAFHAVLAGVTLLVHACISRPKCACMQLQHLHIAVTGVTLNRSLYETVLRELLLERAEHTIELYEGSGAAWRKTRYASLKYTKSCRHRSQ